MATTTITLKEPGVFEGRPVDTLTMRPPLVEDQLAAEATGGTDAQKEVFLIARLCTVPTELIQKLPLREYKHLQKAFVDFLS